jgi:hypothetical protein
MQYLGLSKNIRSRFEGLKSKVGEGDQCLIIANGPSVKTVDFSNYSNYKVMTMNRAYVKWDQLLGREPFLHVCINSLVMDKFKHDLLGLGCPSFYNFASLKRGDWHNKQNLYPILMGFFIGDRITQDIASPFSSSGTVTFVALNLAILLGFKKIVIVGLDHKFTGEGVGDKNKTVSMNGEDQNHFFDSYFPKGMKWELPDLERSEQGYRIINNYCLDHGISIRNESTFTNCDVFPLGMGAKET